MTWVYGIPRNGENRMDSVTSLKDTKSPPNKANGEDIILCSNVVGLMSV